jgi:hypothetical protein
LRDAVVFPEHSVQIITKKPVKIQMNGQNFDLSENPQEVPSYLAVFLIGRNEATLV